jgi:hypothetical protein
MYLEALSRLTEWCRSVDSLDAHYYLYILNYMLFRDGIERNGDETLREMKESKSRATGRRVYCYQWLGKGPAWCPLVHFDELGKWDDVADFYPNSHLLARVKGTIRSIDSQQSGKIRLGGKIDAFFVPKRDYYAFKDLNTEVEFFLGFAYDGFRAWGVRRVSETANSELIPEVISKEMATVMTHDGKVQSSPDIKDMVGFIHRVLTLSRMHPPTLASLEAIVKMEYPVLGGRYESVGARSFKDLVLLLSGCEIVGDRVFLKM